MKFVMSHSDEDKQTTPLVQEPSWTKHDYLVIIAMCSMSFADLVELYLPGVITQSIGCQMKLTKIEEGFLGVTLYVFLALFVMVSGWVNKWFGLWRVMLASQYICAVSIIFCACFPDFYTLVLSRALIGASVGLNYSLMSVFFARNMSEGTLKVGNFLMHISGSSGAAWASIFGYIALDKLGWRLFIVTATLPLLATTIIIFQFFVLEDEVEDNSREVGIENPEGEATEENGSANVSDSFLLIFDRKIFMKSILDLTTLFIGYGSVLLYPALIRVTNSTNQMDDKTGSICHGVVKGEQFLFLTLGGIGRVLGSYLGFKVMNLLSFNSHMLMVAILQCVCYLSVTLWQSNLMVVVVCMSITKVLYAMSRIELNQMAATESYFGRDNHVAANTINQSIGMVGSALGAMNASFTPPQYTSLAPLGMGIVMAITSMLIRDYERHI